MYKLFVFGMCPKTFVTYRECVYQKTVITRDQLCASENSCHVLSAATYNLFYFISIILFIDMYIHIHHYHQIFFHRMLWVILRVIFVSFYFIIQNLERRDHVEG